jgi:hypothetical protein
MCVCVCVLRMSVRGKIVVLSVPQSLFFNPRPLHTHTHTHVNIRGAVLARSSSVHCNTITSRSYAQHGTPPMWVASPVAYPDTALRLTPTVA